MFELKKKSPGFVASANRGSCRIDRKDLRWKALEANYERYYRNPQQGSKVVIPKVFHLIWLGGPVPESALALAQALAQVNPGWEIRWWDDAAAAGLTMRSRETFESAKNWGTKSDILRYEILLQFGGVYLDTDFLPLKPMDDLLSLEFFAGTGHTPKVEVFNSLIGAAPHNPIIEALVSHLTQGRIDESNPEAILDSTGPRLLTKKAFEHWEGQRAVIFPTTYFYPFPAGRRSEVRGLDVERTTKHVRRWIRPESYCAHLWYTAWQK